MDGGDEAVRNGVARDELFAALLYQHSLARKGRDFRFREATRAEHRRAMLVEARWRTSGATGRARQ
jgi:hypothetical protein